MENLNAFPWATIGAMIFMWFVAGRASRANDRDAASYDTDDWHYRLLLHIRQDMQLIAFLLGGVIIMLGVVADSARQ